MMSAAKRTREDDDQIGPDDSSPNSPLSLLLASLLACDPKEIAQQARQCDDETLSKLKAFTRSLGGEFDKISSERREEIAKRAKQEKQYETAKKLGCSDCKTKEEGELKFCAAISDRSCCKDSSVFCGACYQKRKANLKFCAGCKLIICNKCQEEKWGKCCYEVWDMTTSSYVTCPNIFCGDCSLKVDYLLGDILATGEESSVTAGIVLNIKARFNRHVNVTSAGKGNKCATSVMKMNIVPTVQPTTSTRYVHRLIQSV